MKQGTEVFIDHYNSKVAENFPGFYYTLITKIKNIDKVYNNDKI